MARSIGLKRQWFQNENPARPHYDIRSDKLRQMAKARGAVQVTQKYLVEYLRHHYSITSSTSPET